MLLNHTIFFSDLTTAKYTHLIVSVLLHLSSPSETTNIIFFFYKVTPEICLYSTLRNISYHQPEIHNHIVSDLLIIWAQYRSIIILYRLLKQIILLSE